MSQKLISMTLITIVTENLLKDQVIELLKEEQVTGFTITRTDGEGSRGVRASHWEGPNLKFESIVSANVGETVLEKLSEKFFQNYAVIAWLSEVKVVRSEKFS